MKRHGATLIDGGECISGNFPSGPSRRSRGATMRARALYELEYGSAPLNASVVPAANKLVTFRGDAHHRVRPFAAAADDRRVSIVLESYVLPRFGIWRARRLVPTFQVG